MLLSSSIDTFPCARALRRANAHRQAFPPAYPTYVLWDRIFRQALVPDSFARVLDTWHDYTPGSFEVAVKEVLALLTGLASVNRSAASRVLSYAGWDVRQLIERACHTASKDWHRCVPSRDGFRRTTLDAPYRMSDINHERWNPLLTVWEEELVQAHRQIKAFLRRLKEAIENIDQARFEERKRTAFYDDFLKVVTYNSYDWW